MKKRKDYRYLYKHAKKKKLKKIYFLPIILLAFVFTFFATKAQEITVIKKQKYNIEITDEPSDESVNKALMTALVKGKNDTVIDGKAYDYDTDLGTRYFDENVKKSGLPDSMTIFTIGQKLFGNTNFKVSAFYGEYYVVERDELNKDAGKSGVINSNDNLFGGIHEGLDLVSRTENSSFYSLCDGYLINDGSDKYNTIAIYNPQKNVTVLYLHCNSVDVKMKDNEKIFIKKGQQIGTQGHSGLDGGDHVHIEVARGIKKTAYSSKDAVIKALPPYEYIK